MFIPIKPLPLTRSILAVAGDCTLSKVFAFAPEMWREADGEVVPIPTLPVDFTVIKSPVPNPPTLLAA